MKEVTNPDQHRGLNEREVAASRQAHGRNIIDVRKNRFSQLATDLIRDPMLLLLVAAGTIYFVTGNRGDALFMLLAVLVIVSISLYQDRRSQKALDALRALTQPNCRVVRDGNIITIPIADVVIGDYLLAEEGSTIAADGIILQSNDFSVNESALTGESLPVEKNVGVGNNEVYQGTLVTRGLAVCKVTAIGINTKFGKIGSNLSAVDEGKTPLQQQIGSFVRKMAIIGSLFFAVVWGVNLYQSHNVLGSLLKALSLAMSVVPEEIPVAFVTFMAVGAWRLSKLGIIVKNVSTIETLGSATVICTDKTGTITLNKMDLRDLYIYSGDVIEKPGSGNPNTAELLKYAMWASEPIPFDPMEIALHEAYAQTAKVDERRQYSMIHEYPLSGQPPFMTHAFENVDGARIIAAKGAPEGILAVCKLHAREIEKVMRIIQQLTSSGARVLGVASGEWASSEFPRSQTEISFTFQGLVSFYDPPKDNIQRVLSDFYKAGISVKMITGDYPETARSIAKEVGLQGNRVLRGNEVMQLNDDDLQREVDQVNIFARSFPEAKLRILNALKKNGEIVAMTGDGINDAPALKAAHIGIAMGKRGTEVAKQASAMILSDDDLSRMVYAVGAGRKIYANLKNAIQYIISIHIPIILVVLVPLVLNWIYPSLFSPVHIIFLEFIMGPTCSIAYENEPFNKEVMHQAPRAVNGGFFNLRELTTSIIQGLVISIGALAIYQYSVINDFSEGLTRTMVFTMLVGSNIFLTLVNRSQKRPFWVTIRYQNRLIPFIILTTVALTATILFVDPVSRFFQITPPTSFQLLLSCTAGFVSVTWVDLWKLIRNRRRYIGPLLLAAVLFLPLSGQSQSLEIQNQLQGGHYSSEVHKFYKNNSYSLAWTNRDHVQQMISFIQSVSLDGLNPDDYNFQFLTSGPRDITNTDLTLTQSFLALAHDLYQGRIDPDKLFPGDWEACTMPADYSSLLSSALSGEGICETLELLKPMDNGYEGLKYMLSNFRLIESEGGLPVIPVGKPIQPGDVDERVADIRARLFMLGLIPAGLDNGTTRYDSMLVFAINKFQQRHGLKPDGVIGNRTQSALQLTAGDYITTILVNLEKYRWHQSRLLPRSIKINIPSFDLSLSENERTEIQMKVIIGRVDRPTPVLSSAITAMIINPTWTVPPTILNEDLLHVIQSDVGYLKRHSMRVLNAKGIEMNADSLDWSKFSPKHFPYQVQQDPGPNNHLGRIKFLFPNHHSVYLHDTNMPSLFSSQDRALSSGCIRIESPMAVVRLLLPQTGWTEQMVKEQIELQNTKLVLVRNPLPIHLTYFTAFVNNNELYVERDLYGYDKVILATLKASSEYTSKSRSREY